ncbi:hypothetical protein LCGC14_0411770 [marine sediment metagenome]|uniref:Uncharacterized protein n=1 Tax=marine sediment metagenome TaxID=412755 RepID=A0A0F9STQ5_9ZZZZ
MKEHPIIFSTAAIKAILEGQKTQTRQVIKPQPDIVADWLCWKGSLRCLEVNKELFAQLCPYGRVGDRLWVKESWRVIDVTTPVDNRIVTIQYRDDSTFRLTNTELAYNQQGIWVKVGYRATYSRKWQSPQFMPRSVSRIDLEITEIRAERVQEITGEDACREGIVLPFRVYGDGDSEYYESIANAYISHFCALWDSLNAKHGYGSEANPWVWPITFKKEEQNG